MNEQSWMCASCTREKATCFCCCEDRETFLCEDCFCAHYKKNPLQVHIPVPVSAFGQHKNPRYLECLQSRSASIPRAKAEILKNIDAVDQCIAELLQEIEIIVTQLNDFASRTIGQLQDLKSTMQREINEGIAEVEQTMFEHSPALNNKWAQILRNFTGDPTTLACFTYTINPKKVLKTLKSICTFTKFDLEVVVGVWEKKLTVHYPLFSQTQCFTLPLAFSGSTRLCVLGNSQVLAVGPKPPSKRAFLISLQSGEVLKESKMACARSSPGLICVDHTVYVFGGDCYEAEKYAVPTSKWQTMGTIQKYLDHPVLCNFKDTIYLFDYLVICTFRVGSETLENMELLDGYCEALVACVLDDRILLVTGSDRISWWKPEAQSLREQEEEIIGSVKASQCRPILHAMKVYFVSEANGKVKCLDLDSSAVTVV